MTSVEKIFAEKKFPKWFSNHPIFREVKTIKKVFPGIGLPNFEHEMKIDNCDTTKNTAINLIKQIVKIIDKRQLSLKEFLTVKKISAERLAAGNKCAILLSSVKDLLASADDNAIRDVNGKLTIKLPGNISLEDVRVPIFRDGESLFRVYNKLNDLLRKDKFAAMQSLEQINYFKKFSTENIPNNTFKIIFSSDGVEGAWDIGTMSSRGIRSCQSWVDGEYKHCTIGSVIDPFVGIIYLTSGAKINEYGSRMMRRCIVRFVINENDNKPFLLLDHMYPELDTKILTQFKKIIKEKTNNKFEVHYAPTAKQSVLTNSYIPMNDVRKKLVSTSRVDIDAYMDDHNEYDTIQSYQDYKIKNKSGNRKDKETLLFTKNSSKKLNIFIDQFSSAFTNAIRNIDISKFSDNIKPTIRKLKGLDKDNYNYTYLSREIGNNIGIDFGKSLDKNSFTNSNLYFKRLYFNYFVNKNKILNEIKTKYVRELNGKLALKGNHRLRSNHFILLMQSISDEMNIILKKNFKDFLSTGKVKLNKKKS